MAIDAVDPLPPLFGGGASGVVPIEIAVPLTIVQGGTGAMNVPAAAHNILNLAGSQPGDIYYRSSATAVARRAAGTNGYVLTMVSGMPNWAPAAGGVDRISGGTF